jgi:hypothetical protein
MFFPAASPGGPGWAGGRQLSTAAAGVLQALLEPSEYEPEPAKQVRSELLPSSRCLTWLVTQTHAAACKAAVAQRV